MNAPAEDTLTGLAVHVQPLPSTTLVFAAYEAFKAEPTQYAIPVVDPEGRPVGLLNRFKFLELLSQPFAHDLFKHQTVAATMDKAPLIVDEHVPPDQLSHRMIDDGSRYIFDGFIVTRDGRYLGIGTGHSLMRCITERKHATLFHLAHHDSLTGVPNRQLFNDRLTQALAHARRTGAQLGVLFVDVDRFKGVNDSLGHAIGDQLLKAIAERLMASTRAGDTVARLGGDEFAVILPQLGGTDHGEVVARKLLDVLREPHTLEPHHVNVSCSIGLAVYPSDGGSQDELLRSADAAAYHAKQFRNTYQRYSSDLQQPALGTFSGFASVKRAIDRGHLAVAYQPLVVTGSRAVYGLEALVRWEDPDRGTMPTADFIRMAEDAGLIDGVTNFVLGEAMSQMMAWRRAGLCGQLSLAVNVSGVELRDGGCVATIERHLRETGFPARALEIEITESTAMLPGASTAVLKELTAMGVRLSIDDFGTGYSSLSRLRHLPVHALKIDRAFVDDVDKRDVRTLARAIILMAHSLGLSVTGEGVETAEQLAFLERHACDRVQGYFICSPMNAERMTSYLSTFAAP
jgi:diguanylate cyclase (GGDEF)-like protein